MRHFWTRLDWRIALLYALFGCLWIFFSDMLLARLVPDPVMQLNVQHYKGLFFVFASALLILLTLRKKAEEVLISEEKFSTAFRISPDAININRLTDGSYIEINEGFTGLTDFSAEDVIGKTSLELNIWVNPQDRARLVRGLQENGEVKNLEAPFRTKNGEIKTCLMSARLIEVRQETCILSITRDISDRKLAELALAEYNERLERDVQARTKELRAAQETLLQQERLATYGRLAGGVAYELRNPLGVISNAVYYLKLIQPDPGEKVSEYLGILERESQAAVLIISDLLNFSNLQTGDRSPVRVAELLQGVITQYPLPKGIALTLKIPDTLSTIFVDPRQLEQALGQLVDNAYQAMETGGTLAISARGSTIKKKAFVTISIKDNGSGILPENMPKLFEPLFTTKSRRIGLGLALSQRLIEVNGGRIEARSEFRKGSTFIVHLPVKMENLG